MLSTFHVAISVCVPDRWTAGFGASEKISALVAHAAAPGPQTATVVYEAALSVPPTPVPAVHAAALHETSPEVHVVAPATGGAKDGAPARSEIDSWRVSDTSTTWASVTLTGFDGVAVATSATLNAMPAGTMTLACSSTVTVAIVVWLVSGNTTVVCADATPHSTVAAEAITAARSRHLTACSSASARRADGARRHDRYPPMLSNFHVTTSVWLPDRLTAVLAPSVSTSAFVEQPAASVSHVATSA